MEENILCCGCLCAGRKMVIVNKCWKTEGFLQIINEIPMTTSIETPLWLCWECEALIIRFTKFKEQVKKCYKELHYYVERNINTSQLQQPPRLCTEMVVQLSIHPDSDQNFEVIVDIKKEDEPMIEEIKEEDNLSIYSDNLDNLDDNSALIEFKSASKEQAAKKRKKKEKKKRKKKNDTEDDIIQEIELTLEQLEEERRSLAAREDFVNAMFRCEKCILSFPNSDDLGDHVKMKHDANKSRLICTICTCTFASDVSLSYHMGKHKKRYRCAECFEVFPARRHAVKHVQTTHARNDMDYLVNGAVENGNITEDGRKAEMKESNNSIKQETAQFSCEFCAKTFRWKTSLRKHLETHRIETGQKRKPYCEPCRLSFTTTSNLQKHVRTSSKHQIQLKLRKLTESLPDSGTSDHQAHIEQIKRSVNSARQQYTCAQCGRSFQWRGNLLRHLHSHKARASGSLVCTPCNRTFSSIATYTQHMRVSKKHVTEDDFKYMCNECGKKFANKTRLRDHIDWEHLKNYVHTCGECQKVFKSHTSLYLHKQVVHKKDSAEHLCDHCGKHFPNHAKLRSHMAALHSAAAPYRCGVCCARFSWHSCLSRHSRRVHRPRTD